MSYPTKRSFTSVRASQRARRASAVIEQETEEEQRSQHHYNPGLVLIHDDLRIPIGAGTSDHIGVYERGGLLYVLSRNYGLGYIGLAAYEVNTGEEAGEVFLQNDWDLEEILGKNWEDLSEEEIVQRLDPYLD